MAAPTPVISTISDSMSTVTVKVTIPAGGDAELTATNILDLSTFTTGQTVTNCAIKRIDWSLSGFNAEILFEATTDVVAVALAEGTGHLDFSNIAPGGLPNNAGTGKTGDLLLATHGVGTTDVGFILVTIAKIA